MVQIVPEGFNPAGGAGSSGEVGDGVIGDEIDPGSQSLEDAAEFPGVSGTVVPAVYHQVFDGESAAAQLGPAEEIQHLHHRITAFVGDEFGPLVGEGGMET